MPVLSLASSSACKTVVNALQIAQEVCYMGGVCMHFSHACLSHLHTLLTCMNFLTCMHFSHACTSHMHALFMQVRGGTMSHTSRQEAQHSMRPLSQTQGPTAPVVEGYWDAPYSPREGAQGHRIRAPAWSLPPNRSAISAVFSKEHLSDLLLRHKSMAAVLLQPCCRWTCLSTWHLDLSLLHCIPLLMFGISATTLSATCGD